MLQWFSISISLPVCQENNCQRCRLFWRIILNILEAWLECSSTKSWDRVHKIKIIASIICNLSSTIIIKINEVSVFKDRFIIIILIWEERACERQCWFLTSLPRSSHHGSTFIDEYHQVLSNVWFSFLISFLSHCFDILLSCNLILELTKDISIWVLLLHDLVFFFFLFLGIVVEIKEPYIECLHLLAFSNLSLNIQFRVLNNLVLFFRLFVDISIDLIFNFLWFLGHFFLRVLFNFLIIKDIVFRSA